MTTKKIVCPHCGYIADEKETADLISDADKESLCERQDIVDWAEVECPECGCCFECFCSAKSFEVTIHKVRKM